MGRTRGRPSGSCAARPRCIRFADRGSADLSRELAFPFPLEVIAGMLGVPAADRLRYFRWSIDIPPAIAPASSSSRCLSMSLTNLRNPPSTPPASA